MATGEEAEEEDWRFVDEVFSALSEEDGQEESGA